MDDVINQIKSLNNVETIQKINKGFSHDEKFIIDQKYLLRTFSVNHIEKRRDEFSYIKKCSKLSDFVPQAIEFGEYEDVAYMLLEYLPGVDGEGALKTLTDEEQYQAGNKAGRELKKIHQLSAPSSHDWFTIKKLKSDRYLEQLSDVTFDESLKCLLKDFIQENEYLMRGRSSTIQHDDFHPANILIHNKKFSGIIDFQRVDFGDPIHDLHKIGFFSKQVSIPFTRGNIEGYFNGDVPELFWDLYGLYSAMHVVSALVWGERFDEEQSEFLKGRALEVIHDHDNFNKFKPTWAEGM